MTDPNLIDAIKGMLISELNLRFTKEEIADEQPLFGPDGLGLDSIDALGISSALEKVYGVQMHSEQAARAAMANVKALAEFVAENRKI